MKTANFLKIMILFLAIGVASCSSNSTDDGGTTTGGSNAVTIEATKTKVYENTLVSFTVRNAAGADVTSSAVITVDGTVIAGSSSIMSGLGVKSAQATVGTDTSNTLDVEVITPSFTTKMLIEDFTGTWCQFCPRVTKGIDNAKAASNDVVSIALHTDFNNDPFGFPGFSPIAQTFGVSGYPAAYLNRDASWSGDAATNTAQPLAYLNNQASSGLAINSSISGNQVNTTVKVGFDFDVSNTKLMVVLLENGLIATQQNATSHYGGPQSDPNFVHNDVLRVAFTDYFGDVIPDTETTSGNVYSVDLSVNIPSGVQNNNELDIVAMLLNASGEVLNVQHAAVGSNKDFD